MGLNVNLKFFLRPAIPFSTVLWDEIIGSHEVFLPLERVLFFHFHKLGCVEQLFISVKVFVFGNLLIWSLRDNLVLRHHFVIWFKLERFFLSVFCH